MSLGSERADYEEALKKIVISNWVKENPDIHEGTRYSCKFCKNWLSRNPQVEEHKDYCPAYVAEKVLDKHGIKI